jgi:hypothetical protein
MRKLTALACAVLCVTFAGSTLWVPDFGGFEPQQFPVPQDNPPIQPAGYAFAIWGVIYLWLLAGMGFGLLRRSDDPEWHFMRVPLCVSLAIGSVWLSVAVKSPIGASVLIWAMLVTGLTALYRAPQRDAGWAALPLGLYAGWLSAASCVSVGLLAAGYGYMQADIAAYVFIVAALVLASAVQNTLKRAPTYGIAVIWALVALVVQNVSVNATVAALAAGGAAAMILPTWKAWRAAGISQAPT